MAWRTTHGLDHLRSAFDARFPNRDKKSDGTIGDTAHQDHTSGHNPDDTPGSKPAWDGDSDSVREVRAWDADSDLGEPGTTAQMVVDHLRHLPGLSSVIRYMIYNHFEYHERDNFEPTPYAGSSPHEEHIHFEFAWTNAADENTTFDYRLDEIGDADMFLPTNNSTGEEVKFWQHMLEELGFTPGEIDGEYGPKTQAAVAAFRKSLGVTTNYTYLTSWTAFAMFRALAEKYAGKNGEPGKNGKDGRDGTDGQNGTLTGTLSVTGGSLNVEAV